MSAWVFIVLLCLLAGGPGLQARELLLRAGASALDITPEQFPIDSAGSMRPRLASAAHDRLHVRCLVLDNGETKIALAVADSCMIPREIFDAAKALVAKKIGIPPDHILCSATHCHSAVTVTPTFQSKVEEAYCIFLTDKIAEGIIQAYARREPARVGWAVGINTKHVHNRRWYLRPGSSLADPFDRGTDKVRMNPSPNSKSLLAPAGPTDPEIPILAIETAKGQPLALWANYALHYVGGVPSNTLSADYFGEFARQFTRLIGAKNPLPAFVAAMTNGASGDINNFNFFEGRVKRAPFEQIEIVATDVARSAHVAYRRVVYHDWVPLNIKETELELGVRKPTPEEVARAKRLIAEADEGPWSDRRVIYANETLDLADYPATVKAKIQALRIGGLGIVGIPCEVFVETGLALKNQSPLKPSFTIELANGYNGYLPTPEQHALGGYETWRAKSSYLAVDAEPIIRRTALALLRSLVEE